MTILENEPLAPYTSLNVGGPAEQLLIAKDTAEALSALEQSNSISHILGYGCNVLISDHGLAGVVLMLRGGDIAINDTELVADAGAWWDGVVQSSLEHGLWGLELMSEIPSSVGGAIYGNIAAYGQQVSDTLKWIELFDKTTGLVKKYPKDDFIFSYRASSLQQHPEYIILRAGFTLSKTPLHTLKYDSAITIAEELSLDKTNLQDLRSIIIETRARAGSIYHLNDKDVEHSAGSFFKNPMVSTEQAVTLASFDESGKTLERIQLQSQIHGGDTHRTSAAHVLLAAGFHRGQSWGSVKLHDKHVLKIITRDGATAADVYAAVQEITATVKDKLGIELEPEVKFLGDFS